LPSELSSLLVCASEAEMIVLVLPDLKQI